MKNREDLLGQIINDIQMLIAMTPSGPERNRLCDIGIALQTKPVEAADEVKAAVVIGDFKAVNVHQFLDGTGFSYHLLVPQNTQLACRVADSRDRTVEVRPMKSMDEFTTYVYPAYKTPGEAEVKP